MIQVSHEVPLCLLESSKRFNDYQYALVHLLENNEQYREHFLQCKAEGIPIYLDNSLHELGTAIGGDILLKWINILEPKHVFVPDVWEDKNSTLVQAKSWSKITFPKNTTPIAVVQAKSYGEALECYIILKDLGYKKIAFSYGASYYNKLVPHSNPYMGKALGRIQVISKLYHDGIIQDTDQVHLLGCALPQEFGWYSGFNFIKSIDTSNPVMAALEGMRYSEMGLIEKPKANMNTYLNVDKETIDVELLFHNLVEFRKINNL